MKLQTIVATLLFFGSISLASAQNRAGEPWDSVADVLGTAVNVNGGTYRYNLPRSDLPLIVAGVKVLPAMALVSWAGFGLIGGDTVAMGDIVATPAELPRVLEQLHENGISVTAIHNHLSGETPRVMFVHFMTHGAPVQLARKIDRALRVTGVPRPVIAAAASGLTTVDTARIFTALGARGRASGALAQLAFDFVPSRVTLHGDTVPAPLSTTSPVNLQHLSASRVVATGDFTITARQVDRVVNALIAHKITVTAVHSHMVGEEPTLYFVHFWADGSYDAVLLGLRSAIDAARRE